MMESCQDLNKIKQLNIRLSTVSGLFHMMFTAGWDIFKEKGSIYTAVNGLKNFKSTDCTTVGKYFGQLIAGVLQTKTVTALNQAEVSTFGSGNGGSATVITDNSSSNSNSNANSSNKSNK